MKILKTFAKAVALVSTLSIIAVTYAEGSSSWSSVNGPLTSVNYVKNKTASSSVKPQMPAPANTLQFTPQAGGAPTATATQGASINDLPPVVSATNGVNLQNGQAASSQSANSTAVSSSAAAAPVASTRVAAMSAPANIVNSAPSTADINSSLSDAQRLAKLEQQMANITRMNLPQQISELQMQVQQLTGQLQVAQHDLKTLNTQQRTFFSELNKRIDSLNQSSSSTSNVSSSDVAAIANTSTEMKDSNAYKAASAFFAKRDYVNAKKALLAYLDHYPNGHFTANAHYWLGEIYILNSKYKEALSQYQTVISSYAESRLVPDALFKIAWVHLKSGDTQNAKKEFLSIKKKYPNSTAAQLSTIQLKQLNIN